VGTSLLQAFSDYVKQHVLKKRHLKLSVLFWGVCFDLKKKEGYLVTDSRKWSIVTIIPFGLA
tara:strand:+ start:7230 stop:7415 length:186 start_codon:yes stop_codon:yes gene_type:complete